MPLALPSFSGTKDIPSEGIFRSIAVRWAWRFYTQRLTSAGRWFFWPTVAFMSYGSTSLDLQGYIPFSYASGLWIVGLLCMFLIRPRVLFNAVHADRVCAGEILPVDIEVVQTGGIEGTGFTIMPHRLPKKVDAEEEYGTPVPPSERGEKVRLRLGLRCQQRGIHTLRGFRVETDYPLGILRTSQVFSDERQVIVYPRFTPLTRFEIPTGRRHHPGGVAMASQLGDSFEFIGNREYRDGDNLRDIDWRATGRLNKPIVREYREEFFMRAAVILDTHVPRPAPMNWKKYLDLGESWRTFRRDMKKIIKRPRDTYKIIRDQFQEDDDQLSQLVSGAEPRQRQIQHDNFERAVSICAATSDFMARQEYLVDIFAAGPNLYHLMAGRSLAYLDQILEILACVDENPNEPFDTIEPELMDNLSKITVVICVFMDWNRARQEFVHRLRSHGTATKVIIVRDAPCSLDPTEDAELLGEIPIISKAAFENGIEEL